MREEAGGGTQARRVHQRGWDSPGPGQWRGSPLIVPGFTACSDEHLAFCSNSLLFLFLKTNAFKSKVLSVSSTESWRKELWFLGTYVRKCPVKIVFSPFWNFPVGYVLSQLDVTDWSLWKQSGFLALCFRDLLLVRITLAVGCANCSSWLQPPLFPFQENSGEVKKLQTSCFSFLKASSRRISCHISIRDLCMSGTSCIDCTASISIPRKS